MISPIKITVIIIVIIATILVAYWFISPKQVALPDTPTSDPSTKSIPEVTPITTVPPVENSPIKVNSYPNRTDAELNSAIIKAAPQSLRDANGQISFIFVTSISPEKGWYVVTVRTSSSETSDSMRIVIKDNGTRAGGLVLVAGPLSVFPDSINLPVKVRISL